MRLQKAAGLPHASQTHQTTPQHHNTNNTQRATPDAPHSSLLALVEGVLLRVAGGVAFLVPEPVLEARVGALFEWGGSGEGEKGR